jgi:hypothetical protein
VVKRFAAFCVFCDTCGASGPMKLTSREAVEAWNTGRGVAAAEPKTLEEEAHK